MRHALDERVRERCFTAFTTAARGATLMLVTCPSRASAGVRTVEALSRVSQLLAAMMLAACASSAPEDAEESDDFDEQLGGGSVAASWTSIGRGIAYQHVNAGPAILIAYGGYSARLSHSAAWATELVDAKLGAADVGHVYAVKGPADPRYAAREIANTALRAHLAQLADATAPIYVVAHSSGTFVAHELFAQVHAARNVALLSRISYANLDGGGSGLTTAIVAGLANIVFVYARDPTLESGLSQNSGLMRWLGVTYAAHGDAFEGTVPNTGCASGASACLHDVVITHRPHNRWSYDLANDYTDFADRPVTTEYFDLLIPMPYARSRAAAGPREPLSSTRHPHRGRRAPSSRRSSPRASAARSGCCGSAAARTRRTCAAPRA
jgi:hypothetical protein